MMEHTRKKGQGKAAAAAPRVFREPPCPAKSIFAHRLACSGFIKEEGGPSPLQLHFGVCGRKKGSL